MRVLPCLNEGGSKIDNLDRGWFKQEHMRVRLKNTLECGGLKNKVKSYNLSCELDIVARCLLKTSLSLVSTSLAQ